MLNVIKN
nr:unnamed protein product [Callosobruchus chinensis]